MGVKDSGGSVERESQRRRTVFRATSDEGGGNLKRGNWGRRAKCFIFLRGVRRRRGGAAPTQVERPSWSRWTLDVLTLSPSPMVHSRVMR